MVEKINLSKLLLMIKLRSKNKSPDAETIFKDVQRNAATNWTINDVEGNIDLLVASGKLENRPTECQGTPCSKQARYLKFK